MPDEMPRTDVRPMIETHRLAASVAVTCTDRGQHKRLRLTTLEGWWPKDAGTHEPMLCLRGAGRHWGPAGEGLPYEFWCPTCRRNPQVTAARWSELSRGILNERLSEFDVSYLD